MVEFIAASMRQREAFFAFPDTREFGRHVGQLVRYEVNHLTFPLHAAVDGHHACAEDHAALPFVQRCPDHQVRDAGLVLDGDEHDALGGARLLAYQHQTGDREPSAIPGSHGLDQAMASLFEFKADGGGPFPN